jgi:hypothetical protein
VVTGLNTPESAITTNNVPHARISALWPNRRMSPITTWDIPHATTIRIRAIGTSAHPTSPRLKWKKTMAASTTADIPSRSFAIPKIASPAAYSTSRSGVVIMLRRLRDHVSSMNPVATAIWLW